MPEAKLKLAILVPSLHGGGAEFVAREWAKWLADSGYVVNVILTSCAVDVIEPPTNVRVIGLKGRSLVSKIRALAAFVRSERIDVVVGLMPYWNLLALSTKVTACFGPPRVIISNRNLESVLARSFGLKFRSMNFLARLFYRFADGAIAISHPVAAEMVSKYGVDPDRLWVVPNPASGKVLNEQTSAIAGSRVSEDMGAGDRSHASMLDLVVPARLVTQKRPELALEAALLVKSESPHPLEVRVHFFGAGPLSGVVEKRAADMGVLAVMHGWVDQWYMVAPPGSVVLLASAAEGFGNVLVEACAVGLPSVASSRALGVADAIVPGITGVLVSGDSAEDYARGIERARGMFPVKADGWLERFSVASSGHELEIVLTQIMR